MVMVSTTVGSEVTVWILVLLTVFLVRTSRLKISVAGKNISFEADTGRIRSLSSSFLPLANSSWITITGSSFNNGVFEVESVSQFGEFITIMPSHVLVEEVQGADVLIQTDRDQTGSDISFNGNTIRASRTTATGSDVFFQQPGWGYL